MSELVGALVPLAAAFGGAWYGGRLQRSSDRETLARQLQIDSAAQFLGSVADFNVVYVQAWAPGTESLSLSERHSPIFGALLTLESRAAAVGIVGPDDLAAIANEIVGLVGNRGLGTSLDVGLYPDVSDGIRRFKREARKLRPVGQKNGRSRRNLAS